MKKPSPQPLSREAGEELKNSASADFAALDCSFLSPPPASRERRLGGEGLRQSPPLAATDAEAPLWQHLRNRRLAGHKFRRQYLIGEYITDFACIAAGIIVELDGNHHAEAEQRAYDDVRTLFLQTAGFRILRFWNYEVLDNLNDILKAIEQTLSSPSPARRERGLGAGG